MTINSYCLFCHKNMREEGGLSEFLYTNDVICKECRNKMRIHQKHFKVENIIIHGLYLYSGLVREMMLQYKENNDEALFPLFLYNVCKELRRQYKGYSIIKIPSSKESLERRGFDHVGLIYSLLDLPYIDYFEKTEDIEQKARTMDERKEIIHYIKCKNVDLSEKRILVVDDIVTSGYSMLTANALLQGKCVDIRFLTICYSDRYLNNIEQKINKLYINEHT